MCNFIRHRDPIRASRWVVGLALVAMISGPAWAQSDAEKDAKKRWSLSASAGIEYDDNVTTSETDTTSNQSDKAVVLDASIAYKLFDGPELGLEVGYDVSQSFHDELATFDLQSHTASISAEREAKGIDLGLNYLYTRTLLGSDDFLGIHNLSPNAGYLVNEHWYVSGRYSYQNKNFIQTDTRDANQHSVGIDNFIFFLDGKGLLSLGYRAEDENTRGDEFDYFGHFFSARLKVPVPGELIAPWKPVLTFGYSYSQKDYRNVTASIGAKRDDQRTAVTAGLTADITPHVFTTLNVEHIEAISNLPSADSDENIATLSLGVRF